MIKKLAYSAITFLILSCQAQETPTVFSEAALNDTFVNLNGENITFKEMLLSYEGQTVFVDVWASWCRDCIEGLPKLKTIQKEHPDVAFLFLSLDKDIKRWKKGIDKHQIIGEHFFMQSGWDGDFGDFLDLDWIPRYMIIDKEGKIKLFKSVKLTDDNIKKALQ
jgi:thiol-disulfide isomerase/thioredoxin